MEPKKQKTPHSQSYETECSAVPLIFADKRRTFLETYISRALTQPYGHTYWSFDVRCINSEVMSLEKYRLCASTKCALSVSFRFPEFFVIVFSTLSIIASFRLFVNIFLKNDEKMSGNTDLTAFFQN